MTVHGQPNPVDVLLERSDAFDQSIGDCFADAGGELAVTSLQQELAAAPCALCIEHARVLRAAFGVDAPNSGSAVLRLQYEALLRGTWLMFAATPSQVAKLAKTLDLEAEQAAKNLPGYSEMLKAVVNAAPEGLTAPLAQFNKYSRHALNSFVHSGIHPLHRARHGYPTDMALTVVRFSNALMHFAYRLLATLSRSQRLMDRVTRVYVDFPDCVPILQRG